MDLSDIFFMGIVVCVGLLAFALTVFLANLIRGNQPEKAKAASFDKEDEHKGAAALLRAVRRRAAAESWAVIAPVELSGSRDAADLDALVIGWFGVLGIKCIGWGGTIYGSAAEAEWTQVLGGARRSFENPIVRAGKSERAVRDVLFAARMKNVPVETVVVFTNAAAELCLPASTGHYTEKSFLAYLKSSRFEEDKKVDTAAVAALLGKK
ncbi:MAG TPA: NERD domain-containing protein [Candidatus Fournierella merdigallinarum]|nr:NERD domain-containing protein [Candidatus Fournierella merdigallinarum]